MTVAPSSTAAEEARKQSRPALFRKLAHGLNGLLSPCIPLRSGFLNLCLERVRRGFTRPLLARHLNKLVLSGCEPCHQVSHTGRLSDGLHSTVPMSRVDCMGVAWLLKGQRVVLLTERIARFERGLAYYRRPTPASPVRPKLCCTKILPATHSSTPALNPFFHRSYEELSRSRGEGSLTCILVVEDDPAVSHSLVLMLGQTLAQQRCLLSAGEALKSKQKVSGPRETSEY